MSVFVCVCMFVHEDVCCVLACVCVCLCAFALLVCVHLCVWTWFFCSCEHVYVVCDCVFVCLLLNFVLERHSTILLGHIRNLLFFFWCKLIIIGGKNREWHFSLKPFFCFISF